MNDQFAKELGEIKGLLQGIDKKVDGLEARQEKQDDRLRAVERKAMVNSTVVASVVSVAVAFIKQKVGA
ncbi:hypothetical protein [Pseudovibrio sp. Ad37]|uniref:hypothetical protein n=1 Tax=Pseudovibrio sp. Ad37 TaxID=989422 RepID=UPI0007AE9DA1|nr:hypothetical protein [Pseudovibrio sp. Ad37]KZL25660.1 hypothetical protein PsAD37_02254 [Pseudovibrio sp. Ad37]